MTRLNAVDARVWVVPLNDLEALEIRELLQSRGENLLVSNQAWGATWTGLERDIRDALGRFRREHPNGEILGVELGGPNDFQATNVDHHRYSDEDRSQSLSAIEQVATALGVELTHRQKLVAANDRGYIPAMLAAGASADEVAQIRKEDRDAQGLTADDELRAEQDIEQRAEWRGRKVFVRCDGDQPTSAYSDRLFGLADEILLAGSSQWSYSGPRHLLLAGMNFNEQHWCGGDPASGYFGIREPSSATQDALLKFLWE